MEGKPGCMRSVTVRLPAIRMPAWGLLGSGSSAPGHVGQAHFRDDKELFHYYPKAFIVGHVAVRLYTVNPLSGCVQQALSEFVYSGLSLRLRTADPL